jgi:Starter unit:ACP transacylase in aflatoxin biosynthesis
MVVKIADKTILLFGPQALSFDEHDLRHLRTLLLDSATHRWLYDAVVELPVHWNSLVEDIPKLWLVHGKEQLDTLGNWLRTGQLADFPSHLPNILLSPLVVAAHLTQYSQYLEWNKADSETYSLSPSIETLGFCTGLLSAIAVSASGNTAAFQQNGAVAIRLAMLIGAVVDFQDAASEHGESRSVVASWMLPEGINDLSRIIKCYPEVSITQT